MGRDDVQKESVLNEATEKELKQINKFIWS